MKTRTQATTATLNAIANKLQQIDPTMPEAKIRELSISFLIKGLVDSGQNIRQAFDTVMGDGAYNRMADQVYEAAQAKA